MSSIRADWSQDVMRFSMASLTLGKSLDGAVTTIGRLSNLMEEEQNQDIHTDLTGERETATNNRTALTRDSSAALMDQRLYLRIIQLNWLRQLKQYVMSLSTLFKFGIIFPQHLYGIFQCFHLFFCLLQFGGKVFPSQPSLFILSSQHANTNPKLSSLRVGSMQGFTSLSILKSKCAALLLQAAPQGHFYASTPLGTFSLARPADCPEPPVLFANPEAVSAGGPIRVQIMASGSNIELNLIELVKVVDDIDVQMGLEERATMTTHSNMDQEYYFSGDYNYSYDPIGTGVCSEDEVISFGTNITPGIFILVVLFSCVGNTLVVWVLVKFENLKSLTNTFLLNLAISDLVFTIGLPFWAHYYMNGWTLGDHACKAVHYIFYTGYYSSLIFLTVLTVHRYIGVVHPMSVVMSRKSFHCYATSIVIWIISLCAAIPQAMHVQVAGNPVDDLLALPDTATGARMLCEFHGDINWKRMSTYLQNTFFIIAFVIIVFCYSVILKRLLRPTSHSRRKTVQLILFIVVFFFLGWAPYNVAIFLKSLISWGIPPFNECEVSKGISYCIFVSQIVAFSHCCVNPVVYVFMGIKFRNHLKKMLWTLCKKYIESQNRHSRLIYSNGEEISMMEGSISNFTDVQNSSEDYGDDEPLIKMCSPQNYKTVTGVWYAIIFCISILGNGFLVYTLTCREDLKKATTQFMLCLALFDLLFTLTLPFWSTECLHHWVFGEAACKIMTGAYFVGLYGSLILLTAMSLDRFAIIVVRSYWLTRSRRLKCTKAACAGAWIISLVASLKDAVVMKVKEVDIQRYSCESINVNDESMAYYVQFVLFFLLPFAIIVFCYTKILCTSLSISSQSKNRTVVLVLCIIVAFFTCWGPYHVLLVLMPVYEFDACKHHKLHLTFTLCRILAYSHCCMNPVFYFLKNLLTSVCSPGFFRRVMDRDNCKSQSMINQRDAQVCEALQTNATELNIL
ncbi:hypothetical protein DNTS_025646 [Danionella cerebrum]|uniref:G-protein coupled receptors family 1 profile domain-containing protein n=1 Tax=Danionella cerebrum TaxID=2873325 RepID=A0A553MRJ7_9TELE|nr:hypothetical protein DNTS_025646 [Danionella translucida]